MKIGRVKLVYTGKDGCIRGATVEVSSNGKREKTIFENQTKVLRKPLAKLLPLEVSDTTDVDERGVTKPSEQNGERPKRKTAEEGENWRRLHN